MYTNDTNICNSMNAFQQICSPMYSVKKIYIYNSYTLLIFKIV